MSAQASEEVHDIEREPLLSSALSKQIQSHNVNVQAIMIVGLWIVVSSTVIIFNKWTFSSGGFPFPLTLTCLHMVCCFVVFGSIRKFAPENIRKTVMPDADVDIPRDVHIKNLLICVFFAASLAFGNMAYMFASVPFVQMIKPLNCVCVSLAAFAVGMEAPTCSHMIIVAVIALGVMVASDHAVDFSMIGCLLQIAASVTEGLRLALVQAISAGGLKLDPVTVVYQYSLPSAIILAGACLAFERNLDFSKLVSPWILVLNCALAVFLNVMVAAVIKNTSAVIFTLCGVFKDIILITVSAIIFVVPISKLTMCGYFVSLSGLFMYKVYKDNFALFKQYGFLGGMMCVLKSKAAPPETL
jgi:hypothetical protein